MARSPLISQYDLSSIKAVTSGAAPLSTQIEREFRRKVIDAGDIRQGITYYLSLTLNFMSTVAIWYSYKASCGRPG